jgi:asparagine synthase (glutamine-hydrolysing)
MSGIVGIYYLDGRPVEKSEIQGMLNTISHRGPDGSGIWTDGSMGLGHQMLHTTPESLHEKLPLTNQRGDLTITADARIDNRDELFRALDFNGRPRETIPDSEVILAAYEKWGEQCPEKLLGDFAFAIWDDKKKIIFCARDHFGVKPFYYFRSDKVFTFASEIKSLLCLADVPRRLNEVAIADYLASLAEDKSISFYKGILRLPPGNIMTLNPERILIRDYWALDPSRHLKLGSDEEYAEAFRDLFREAVHCRLRSAFPVGSMLSGGLDSSSIVCMARQIHSQNGGNGIHTFSAIFDDVPQCDEQPYINAVVSKGDLNPHYIHADRINPFADLEKMLWHQDDAFRGVNLFMYWNLYGAARDAKVRVILDGEDGDTTVSHGRAYLGELLGMKKWRSLALEVKEFSKKSNSSQWEVLWSYAIKPQAPQFIRRAWRLIRRRTQYSRLNGVINPEFAKRIGLKDRIQGLQQMWFQPVSTEQQNHYRELSSGINVYALEMIDKAAMPFSLEPRYAFYDKRLAEFCLALPPEQKLYHGWTRVIMRRAMESILPQEVQWRNGKTNLGPNFVHALSTFGQDRLEETINHNSKIIQPYINTTTLRKIFQRFLAKGEVRDAFAIWSSTLLCSWLSQTGLSPGNN